MSPARPPSPHRPHTLRGLVIILVAVLALTLAPGARAAPRSVAFGTFGAVLDPSVVDSLSPAELNAQMATMARNGIESLRANLFWRVAEPGPDRYDWGPSDQLVLAAAAHHLQLLPIVEFTPRWASTRPRRADFDHYPPRDERAFTAFMRALVGRYGPRGTLWRLVPSLRRYAVHDWQIWNEPAGRFDWGPQPWAATYVPLLRAGYVGVHDTDPTAKVVIGSVVGLNEDLTPWGEAASLYDAGARRSFDVMAVNAYTNADSPAASVAQSLRIVDYVRTVMSRSGDAAKPLWVTEFTWLADLGLVPSGDYLGIETSPAGQSDRLTDYYSYLATHRTGITRAFWYTWATSYSTTLTNGLEAGFAFSGLNRWSPDHPFSSLPLLTAYANVAARYEGCRKTSLADVCSHAS